MALARPPIEIVWFKRDLRIHDHDALDAARRSCEANGHGLLPLYVIEPGLWALPDADAQHWRWIAASLRELSGRLDALGAPLLLRSGDVVATLADLSASFEVRALHSHQETGVAFTYARDRAVGAWCRQAGVPWMEHRQFGVLRGLRERDGWATHWEAFVSSPMAPTPTHLPGLGAQQPAGMALPALPVTGLADLTPALADGETRCWDQQPGEAAAEARLNSFLSLRGAAYHREMSSPATAADACSRLSAALAWGNLSLRRIVADTREAQRALKANDGHTADGLPFARAALTAFSSRLHWHCHFIQKLESEPALEFESFNRAVDDVRARPASAGHLEAWCMARTGLPFVDACMRQLQTTGWINFRMRAMLVAVAAYHLWIDWRDFRDFLARQFVDYEPGIHIAQIQMQSGITGINTLRIYNPVKQGHDQDPEGAYLRRWLPELAALEGKALHEPWSSPIELAAAGLTLGADYPERVVDHVEAARSARTRLGTALSTEAARAESARVMREHGSRKRTDRRRRTRSAA